MPSCGPSRCRWRTLALRLAGWLALGAVPILALALLLDGLAGWTAADLSTGTLPGYLLVTASGLLAAARASVLGGGATAMAVMVGLYGAGRTWPAWSRSSSTAAPATHTCNPARPGWSGSASRPWSRRRCWPSAAPMRRRASPTAAR